MNRELSERIFFQQLSEAGIDKPEKEYKFHPARRWRFDYAFPRLGIAVEVEGAVWVQGRHTRGSGFVKDMEKYNAAAELLWLVLRVQPSELHTKAADMVARTYHRRLLERRET